ncbi:MAG: type 1 glutamine amidotransferase [Nocardioidaceae bacterium]
MAASSRAPHQPGDSVGRAAGRSRVLVVQHQDSCPPALFGGWLGEAGPALDVRRPDRGESLPADLDGHAGLLVLGGSMGAHDDAAYPWLTATKDLLRLAVTTQVPTLGICLGHQLAAVALGGRSEPNPDGQTAGVRSIGWSAAVRSDPLFAPLAWIPDAVVPHWNSDILTRIPSGSTELATTADGAPQVIRLGERAWGVQFHPEADHAVVTVWADQDRDDAVRRGVDVDAALQQIKEAARRLNDTGRQIAVAFGRILRTVDD